MASSAPYANLFKLGIFFGDPTKQAGCLRTADTAEVSSFRSPYRPVLSNVLKNHLFLL
jgi:hypothetical protein